MADTLALDPARTALALIDLQHGILGLPLSPHAAPDVVARAVALGRALGDRGGLVVPVTVAFAEDGADRLAQPTDAPMAAGAPGPDWSRLVPEVEALPARVRITKRQQSAFYGTELDLQLRRRGIGTLIVCGIATNFGVEATVRDAYAANYAVLVAEDACTSVGEGLHAFAVERILPRFARVRSTAEILAALGG